MAPMKQIGLSFSSNPTIFPQAVPTFVFNALKYDFTTLESEFQGMAFTPSCKGMGIDSMNYTNHIQRYTHVRAPNSP